MWLDTFLVVLITIRCFDMYVDAWYYVISHVGSAYSLCSLKDSYRCYTSQSVLIRTKLALSYRQQNFVFEEGGSTNTTMFGKYTMLEILVFHLQSFKGACLTIDPPNKKAFFLCSQNVAESVTGVRSTAKPKTPKSIERRGVFGVWETSRTASTTHLLARCPRRGRILSRWSSKEEMFM